MQYSNKSSRLRNITVHNLVFILCSTTFCFNYFTKGGGYFMKQQNKNISEQQLLLGIVLAILTYWLFAQSFLNIGPKVQGTVSTSPDIVNISISLTSFVTGVFMVVAGNISDRYGMLKMTRIALVLSIVGSLMLIITNSVVLLLVGRMIQGLSAAILMPATISMVNYYFEGASRQRALSFWSIGAFGGTGLSSFFAGAIATFFNWQAIFMISIIVSVCALFLFKNLSNQQFEKHAKVTKFDIKGLVLFIVMIASISFVITQGYKIGWLSAITFICIGVFIICGYLFYYVEQRQSTPFINLQLFKNKPYIGAVIANFLLNTGVGVIALLNMYIQSGIHLSPLYAGLITLPYLIALLIVIRLGEKSIKRFGAKRAMIVGPILTALGVILFSCTFLNATQYIVLAVIASVLFGAGTGLFATPALSTAVSTTDPDKVGVASGIFKMGSTLGGAFGIAIMTSLFTGVMQGGYSVHVAAGVGFIVGSMLIFGAVCASAIVIPTRSVKGSVINSR